MTDFPLRFNSYEYNQSSSETTLMRQSAERLTQVVCGRYKTIDYTVRTRFNSLTGKKGVTSTLVKCSDLENFLREAGITKPKLPRKYREYIDTYAIKEKGETYLNVDLFTAAVQNSRLMPTLREYLSTIPKEFPKE